MVEEASADPAPPFLPFSPSLLSSHSEIPPPKNCTGLPVLWLQPPAVARVLVGQCSFFPSCHHLPLYGSFTMVCTGAVAAELVLLSNRIAL